jgi:uncharacterized membrane protein YgcG
MEKQNAFLHALQLIPQLEEYQKKQLAIVLIGSTLTETSEEIAQELSKLQRYK